MASYWLTAAAGTPRPDEIPGLEAWYDTAPLHEKTRNGERVDTWSDSSGNGHDLIDERTGLHATWSALRFNGMPAVEVRKANSHSVTRPFVLEDHTIFLVHGAGRPGRALFSDESNPFVGLVLRDKANGDRCQLGPGKAFPYNDALHGSGRFDITVLGRKAGVLRSFIDGTDVSSGAIVSTPLSVGRFFLLNLSARVHADGEGLEVAEMLFYSRFLEDAERESVTRYLADKYGVELTTATARRPLPFETGGPLRVRLGTDEALDLNESAVRVRWTVQQQLDPPFRRDPDAPSRIYCTRDGTRARLSVVLSLATSVPQARLRLLILQNGTSYLPDEAASEPFDGVGDELVASGRLDAALTLDAGDFFEVIASRAGAPGAVTLAPDQTTLMIRAF